VHYTVSYVFSGFLSFSSGISGPFKAGSAVPVKWQLKNAQGGAIGSLSAITSVQFIYGGACGKGFDGEAIIAGSPGNSGLQYDLGAQQFQFNWKTPSDATPGCYSFQLTLDDGTTHSAVVTLR